MLRAQWPPNFVQANEETDPGQTNAPGISMASKSQKKVESMASKALAKTQEKFMLWLELLQLKGLLRPCHVGSPMPAERTTVGTTADKTKGQKKLVQTAKTIEVDLDTCLPYIN